MQIKQAHTNWTWPERERAIKDATKYKLKSSPIVRLKYKYIKLLLSLVVQYKFNQTCSTVTSKDHQIHKLTHHLCRTLRHRVNTDYYYHGWHAVDKVCYLRLSCFEGSSYGGSTTNVVRGCYSSSYVGSLSNGCESATVSGVSSTNCYCQSNLCNGGGLSDVSLPDHVWVTWPPHCTRISIYGFYRATAMLSAVHAVVVYLSVRLSVCVSVTLRYCVKMAKRRITQIMPHERDIL